MEGRANRYNLKDEFPMDVYFTIIKVITDISDVYFTIIKVITDISDVYFFIFTVYYEMSFWKDNLHQDKLINQSNNRH